MATPHIALSLLTASPDLLLPLSVHQISRLETMSQLENKEKEKEETGLLFETHES